MVYGLLVAQFGNNDWRSLRRSKVKEVSNSIFIITPEFEITVQFTALLFQVIHHSVAHDDYEIR